MTFKTKDTKDFKKYYFVIYSVIWGKDGCNVKQTNATVTICECEHLTNFAILMSPWTEVKTKFINMWDFYILTDFQYLIIWWNANPWEVIVFKQNVCYGLYVSDWKQWNVIIICRTMWKRKQYVLYLLWDVRYRCFAWLSQF